MKITDPVCKMTIEEEDAAATSSYKGKMYHFCSTHCKQSFENSPEAYLVAAVDDRKKEQAGGKPKVEWTCPMHPEIIQDKPGSCPKCGMALEPKTATLTEEESNPEYEDMRKRFILGAILALPLLIIAMRGMVPGGRFLDTLATARTYQWLELILATPIVLWAGWPFLFGA